MGEMIAIERLAVWHFVDKRNDLFLFLDNFVCICKACLQGLTGITGLRGRRGSPGEPGRLGMKGNTGRPGNALRGPKGDMVGCISICKCIFTIRYIYTTGTTRSSGPAGTKGNAEDMSKF